jgi:sugar lactone lactonase YvrE
VGARRVLAAGTLVFPEGPRWHHDRLWVADQHAHRVVAIDLDGNLETVAELPDRPSGIGFLGNGDAIFAGMRDRVLFRLLPGGRHEVYADLSGFAGDFLNDMVIDGQDRAYVGMRIRRGTSPAELRPAESRETVILVRPDGKAEQVATEMFGPNGSVVTPDNRTLIVAETRGGRLTAFDIRPDGRLENRRVWGELGEASPDGICLDAEGAIWIGNARAGRFERIVEGGEVTGAIEAGDGRHAIACMLGGPERKHLFMLITRFETTDLAALETFEDDLSSPCRGWVEVEEVEVPGAGRP